MVNINDYGMIVVRFDDGSMLKFEKNPATNNFITTNHNADGTLAFDYGENKYSKMDIMHLIDDGLKDPNKYVLFFDNRRNK